MTPEDELREKSRAYVESPDAVYLIDALAAIERARREERERMAQVCDKRATDLSYESQSHENRSWHKTARELHCASIEAEECATEMRALNAPSTEGDKE